MFKTLLLLRDGYAPLRITSAYHKTSCLSNKVHHSLDPGGQKPALHSWTVPVTSEGTGKYSREVVFSMVLMCVLSTFFIYLCL